jgi:hypothetical protein
MPVKSYDSLGSGSTTNARAIAKRSAAALMIALIYSKAHPQYVMSLEVVVLGVGAGSTCTHHGESSSSFMICLDGTPVLMLDVVSSTFNSSVPC